MKKLSVDPRARALIFDLDGTLVDSMPLHYKAWEEVCALKGIKFSEKEFYELAGVPTDKIVEIQNKKHDTNFDINAISQLKDDTYLSKISQLNFIVPVFELMKKYHEVLPMSIGTGSPEKHSWEAVKALGIDKYIDILVSKNDVKEGKPHPETFLKCAKAMNIEPRYCQVFEDGDPGLQAAESAGMIATDIRLFL